jgi:hypothetical protein
VGKKTNDKRRAASQKRKREKRTQSARATRALGATSLEVIGSWPLKGCWVTESWNSETRGLVQVTVARAQGKVWATVVFLVDLDCLGVKNIILKRGQTLEEHLQLREYIYRDQACQDCKPELAAKIVRQGVRYAESLGFPPIQDYTKSLHLIAGIDADRCQEEITVGRNGKPFYVAGPHDDAEAIHAHLEDRVGPDGFHFIMPGEFLDG